MENNERSETLFTDLILQILMILFPILIYYALFRRKIYDRKKRCCTLTIVCTISVLFCMTYPASIGNDNILDLRVVPWFISFFYGGPISGLIVTFILMLYKFYIEGIGAYTSLLVKLIMIIIFHFFSRKYIKLSFSERVYHMMLMGLFYASLVVFTKSILILNFSLDKLYYLCFYTTVA